MKGSHELSNEIEIVQKAQNGDLQALNQLLSHYQKLALYIALKICHCDADAEDIVQESFIEVQKSIKNLNEPQYFKAWLNRIIFSKSTKLFRKNKDILLPDDDPVFSRMNEEQRTYMIPDKNMKFESDAEVLRQSIDSLPDKFRTIIYLKYFEQMSIQEIAIALDIPLGTVKSRLNYARGELKGVLRKYEQDNNTTINFSMRGLEVALLSVFAKETTQYLPFAVATKGFSFSFKGHVIEPSLLAIATIGTVATVGAASIALPYIQDAISKEQELVQQPIQEIVETRIFTPIVFQGVTLETEKAAYKALTSFAHCHVELEEYSIEEQAEAMQVYNNMKQHGGAYYELLKNRGYTQ